MIEHPANRLPEVEGAWVDGNPVAHCPLGQRQPGGGGRGQEERRFRGAALELADQTARHLHLADGDRLDPETIGADRWQVMAEAGGQRRPPLAGGTIPRPQQRRGSREGSTDENPVQQQGRACHPGKDSGETGGAESRRSAGVAAPRRGAILLAIPGSPVGRPAGRTERKQNMELGDIKRIAVVGLGKMGVDWVANLVEGGYQVVGFDTVEAARERAPKALAKALGWIAKKRHPEDEGFAEAAAARFTVVDSEERLTAELGSCQVLLEVILEDLGLKCEVLAN